jgi:mannitol-specific phosphotransferase system IIBC component
MLKNVLFKTVNEINKVKGFHCVLANILDECEIISKRDLYRLAKEKYSSALINEVKGFFETELPEVEENIIKQIQEYNKLGELLDGFEQMYFDSDGNPKIEA